MEELNSLPEKTYFDLMKKIVKVDYPKNDKTKILDDLNGVLEKRNEDYKKIAEEIAKKNGTITTYVDKPTIFEITEATIKDIYNTIIKGKETGLNNLLNNTESGLAAKTVNTKERVALMSLYYNNPSLIGKGPKSAIKNGNRAEAWFEIRYGTNSGSSKGWGIAKRRVAESNMFGLFSNSGTAKQMEKEYRDVYVMYNDNKSEIVVYENSSDKFIKISDRVIIFIKIKKVLKK